MHYKCIFCLIVIFTSIWSGQLDAVKRLKAATDTKEYAQFLRTLGTPDSTVTKFTTGDYSGLMERLTNPDSTRPLFTRSHFIRSETFKVNLDTDSMIEYVSQIVFKTGDQKTDTKYYFVYIHDDNGNKNTLLKFLLFEELLCDMGAPNPMTFGFHPIGANNGNIICFDIRRAESCGDEIYLFSRVDTLYYITGKYKYAEGTPFDVYNTNRMQMLDELEDE